LSFTQNLDHLNQTSSPPRINKMSFLPEDMDAVNIASISVEDENDYTYYNMGVDSIDENQEDENINKIIDEEIVKMPEEFYNNFENFINRPPPKISNDNSKLVKSSKITKKASSSTVNNFIKQKQQFPSSNKNGSNCSDNIFMANNIKDHLLREAFAYTEKLMHV